ncbi:MAG: response regulator [Fibrobacterota bacterium]
MNKDPSILVVDDEEDILELVAYNLERSENKVFKAKDGESALDTLWDENIDLVILDVMLPGMNGLDVLRTMRDDPRTESIPVILLTAKSTEIDKIVAFELGTDDYICKPFSVKELVVRSRAILKRVHGYDKNVIFTKGDLQVNFNKHKIMVKDQVLNLSPKEFAILEYLYKKRDKVMSRDDILEKIWGMDSTVDIRTVDVNITRLRDKLGPVKKILKTVKGYGYILDLDVL